MFNLDEAVDSLFCRTLVDGVDELAESKDVGHALWSKALILTSAGTLYNDKTGPFN